MLPGDRLQSIVFHHFRSICGVHTNTIEGFWSELKRTINGTYVQVSPKHLDAYVQEAAYRYDTRKSAGKIATPMR